MNAQWQKSKSDLKEGGNGTCKDKLGGATLRKLGRKHQENNPVRFLKLNQRSLHTMGQSV